MTEFSKPILTEEAPEPPLVEQKPLEHENEQLRQTLAKVQSAKANIEETGLGPKPVAAAPKIEPEAKVGKKAQKPKPQMKPKAQLTQAQEPDRTTSKKTTETAKQRAEKSKEEATKPEPDKALLKRQLVINEAVGSMAGNPDPDVFNLLLKLFADAPEKEIPAAAMIISTAYLRTSAKQRQPVLKALQPALRAYRASKLAALISAKLGAALVAKPPAPPPPAPPGG